MSEWTTTTIAEIAEIFDGPHATPKKTESGPWFLSISSLNRGQLDLSQSAHLSEEDFIRWTRRVTPRSGDLLFSYETRLGEAALMPDGLRACLGRRMGLLRPKKEKVSPHFLLYAYLGPDFQNTIQERCVHGATVDRIPLTEMGKWPISLPPREEQEAIASLLRDFDEKITINDRIAATCHQIAQALTKKALAGAPLTPLTTLAEITMGSSPPGITYNESGQGLPFYQGTKDFGFRYPRRRVWCSAPTRIARPSSTLFSVRAPVGQVNMAREACSIGRGIAAFESKFNLPSTLFHTVAANPSTWSTFESEGTIFGAIKKKQLEALQFPALVGPEKGNLENELSALDAQVANSIEENAALAELRDALLPKLMSGEIRIRDAERVVEDAV